MLDHVSSEKIMYIDIETVPQYSSFDQLDNKMQEFWERKSSRISKEDVSPEEDYARAGIYSEFGKIVCISAGIIKVESGERTLRVKSFYGHDEVKLLNEFSVALKSFTSHPGTNICGHNVKEFDFPYIARRMIINGLPLPDILDVAGKKPWEVKFIDTLDLWKFGDFKHYTSLNLLTHILGIPSPKDDIDGSQVASVYYEENDVDRIAKYCEKDVLATTQLFLRLKGEPLLNPEKVFSV
ncbi:ribonuclease H-like domain-containing protein [Marinilabilia rubra]|uniref:3'-5' exonuclease n=1 Tax=Marinilabilia rubra TaxID=2162893 RepID=A0A2U2B9U0_9BACT|nr:ribonuclease H-like domain-containing protein [Marinilabilia rubra]PWD99841.1 3'-5' exonuclease [Marinilabilia rubra]